MKRCMSVINFIEEKFLIISFSLMVLLIFTQVLLRAVGIANSWSEETARYLFIWSCWVGVSLAQRYKQHIRISLVKEKLPATAKLILEIITILILLTITIFIVYLSVGLVQSLMIKSSVSAYIRLPMWIVYLALPAGISLYALRLFFYLINLVRGVEEVD